MYKKGKYSLINLILRAEASTLSPLIFKQTPTLDTKMHPKDHPDIYKKLNQFIKGYLTNNNNKFWNNFSLGYY